MSFPFRSSAASPLAHNPRAIVFALLAGLYASFGLHAVRAQDPAPKPVLVELFTSEGCSDCPPADELLARLDREQFAPGVHAIVLSEHVTYWNHLGWRDPFSLEQMDSRQRDYQDRFNLDSVYTPQMVVDGSQQFVGNNARALDRAMARAAADSKQQLQIENARLDKDTVRFSVTTNAAPGQHLLAALAQDVTRSEVSVGENAGRTLHHVAVVRTLKEFNSSFTGGKPLSLPTNNFGNGSNTGAVRLVVFLADAKTGHIVGTSEMLLTHK